MTLTEWMGVASTAGFGVMAFLKFLQSQKVDAVTKQSGAASNHRAGTEQIIEGYDRLLLRAQLTIDDDQEVKKILEERADRYLANWQGCMKENARLRRKFGSNGDDNGDTPQPPNKE